VWKTSVYASGVDLDGRLRGVIEGEVRAGLDGLDGRIGHVHVTVYGELAHPGLYTCYVRVDALPEGGVALGDTAAGIEKAVSRAVSRIAAALRGTPAEGGRPRARGLVYGFLK
jgi:hypothetical protein